MNDAYPRQMYHSTLSVEPTLIDLTASQDMYVMGWFAGWSFRPHLVRRAPVVSGHHPHLSTATTRRSHRSITTDESCFRENRQTPRVGSMHTLEYAENKIDARAPCFLAKLPTNSRTGGQLRAV